MKLSVSERNRLAAAQLKRDMAERRLRMGILHLNIRIKELDRELDRVQGDRFPLPWKKGDHHES